MSDPAGWSLAQARQALGAGRIAPRELAQACGARIARWQPRINAFVSQEEHGAGVPLAHKDMFYRAGRVSNCGSKIRRGWIASQTAVVLARLDAAGYMQIGTLNMSEFAYGPTGHNQHWGDCCNPWNPEYIAGGSSSGSAAAVAARLAYGALGSDTGGSVRIPAAACGVTGLKTTWGRVPLEGAMPLSQSLDTIGPLARSAEDCAVLFSAIGAVSCPEADVRKMRIALSTPWIETHAEPEVAACVLAAAGALRAAGAELVEVDPPDFDTLSAHCLVVMQAEASARHARWMRSRAADYSPAVRARLEAGYAIPASAYLEVLAMREAWLERFCGETLARADLYLTPVMPVRVPTREQTGAAGGAAMPALLAQITRLTRWVNYLGVPALALPCGFDARGLPVGAQLVARPHGEPTLLAAGRALQRETDWHQRAPAERS